MKSGKNIYEYSQIDNLTNGTQLSTYEHLKFFEYAFKYSKKEVVIISPWIRWEIIEVKKDDLDKESKEFFINMQKNILIF